jgi:hypothetical protein
MHVTRLLRQPPHGLVHVPQGPESHHRDRSFIENHEIVLKAQHTVDLSSIMTSDLIVNIVTLSMVHHFEKIVNEKYFENS